MSHRQLAASTIKLKSPVQRERYAEGREALAQMAVALLGKAAPRYKRTHIRIQIGQPLHRAGVDRKLTMMPALILCLTLALVTGGCSDGKPSSIAGTWQGPRIGSSEIKLRLVLADDHTFKLYGKHMVLRDTQVKDHGTWQGDWEHIVFHSKGTHIKKARWDGRKKGLMVTVAPLYKEYCFKRTK